MSTHCGICFGQGHTESQCDSKPRSNKHRQVMPIRNVGETKVIEPTVPMDAVETLTVKDIMHRLVERNLQAWKALPESVRDKMLDHPQDFQLIPNDARKEGDYDYNIVYSGTVWRYHNTALVWTIHKLLR